MALSDEERRRLEKLEQELAAADRILPGNWAPDSPAAGQQPAPLAHQAGGKAAGGFIQRIGVLQQDLDVLGKLPAGRRQPQSGF